MDYLRTLGSAAVSSLVQKSGLNVPFTLGQKIMSFDPLWSLYDGTKRDDGTPISIFEYEFNNKNLIPLAKNSLRKLRTVRHPDVLKFMDVVETDTAIHIMTERVRPLSTVLNSWSSKPAQEREDWLLWGLHRITVALAFVNDSCTSTHGNIRVNSIFISPSGEWKLGGFDVLSSPNDDAAILYTIGGLVPDALMIAGPEMKKSGWSVLKDNPTSAADAYALGLLLHAVFNPDHPPPPTTQPPHPPPHPSTRGSIPKSIFPSYKKLLNPNPKVRMSPKSFLELGMAQTLAGGEGSGFFVDNRLVKVCAGLDTFALASEAEKTALLRTLKDSASSFPPEFASHRVLPSLISALDFGGASAAAILPLVLQLGTSVSPADYSSVILVPLMKLYASPDRGTRMALLEHLPEYADKLDKKGVVDKIWPHLQTGFSDTVAVIREATIKSISLLAPKLNDRILNNDLLRYLAKLQTDSEPSIRTNTCILIGRLAPSLGYNTKRKMLVPAFSRALRDTFVHARVAGLMAFMASVDVFEIEEIATKVVPSVAVGMVDKEKLVRDQAFKAIELFVKKLEAHAETMPETVIVDSAGGGATLAAPLGQATLVNSAAGAAGALAGWAISSLGKKLATADMQSTISTAAGIDRPTSAPPPVLSSISGPTRPNSLLFVPSTTSAANSTVSSPNLARATNLGVGSVGPVSRTKGMQLGASKVPASVAAAALVAQLEEEAAAQEGNPWGTDDLIDINADEDDWSAFESAPVPGEASEPSPLPVVGLGLSLRDISVEDSWNGIESRKDRNDTEFDPWNTKAASTTNPSLSTQTRVLGVLSDSRDASMTSSRRSTSVSSPPPPEILDDTEKTSPNAGAAPLKKVGGMSKEDKAAEMTRRKEERRQRIALLKEQKKNAASGKA